MSELSPELLLEILQLVGPEQVLQDAESLARYGGDRSGLQDPAPSAVLLPAELGEVQQLIRLAARHGLAVVPSGGRTGLSGGALAASGELVLAMDRMDCLSDFNPVDRTVRCGAGVITANLQEFARDQGLYYPVDFASSGSSQVGGNVATNAGGIRVIRYGMTRDWVAGMTVVTGAGEVLELNRGLIKNNAGYDLRQLFVGSEGTLGVIVDVTMRLESPPPESSVLVLGVPDMESLMPVLQAFRAGLGGAALSAFEFFSEAALQRVTAGGNLQRPFPQACAFYALLEIEHGTADAKDRLMDAFEHCVEQGRVIDGVISQSLAQARSLWRLREDISETLSAWTPYKNDLSVRVSKVPGFLSEVESLVSSACPEFELIWYGHIGDGNVHLNILKPGEMDRATFQRRCAALSAELFALVQRYGGSVSAEHGVGLLKRDYLGFSRSAEEIRIMRELKRVFDPAGIMNPGKLLTAD